MFKIQLSPIGMKGVQGVCKEVQGGARRCRMPSRYVRDTFCRGNSIRLYNSFYRILVHLTAQVKGVQGGHREVKGGDKCPQGLSRCVSSSVRF